MSEQYNAFNDRADLLPKLYSYLKRGYDFKTFRADFIAGLTVAIVALPLSMAIAIASNASPEVGLKTAFVAGFWISFLGGARFQIGGPTAAFAIVVANISAQHGIDGLIIATFLAGGILMLAAIFKLGVLLKYVPQTVIIGFTAGIAVTIFISQIGLFFGLTLAHSPIETLDKLMAYIGALNTINYETTAISIFGLILILTLRKIAPNLPYFLFVVILGSFIVAWLNLPVQTVGDKFGVLHTSIPKIIIPVLTYERVFDLLPPALTIAFLAGIESLLSAVVADGMTGGRHRPNAELMGQGFANIMSAITGGLPATGAIARTATNIRSGAKTPMAGVLHATLLLIILMIAGKLTAFIPMAILSAILMVVAWNMAETDRFMRMLIYSDNGDRVVLLSTFVLTIFADLTVAVEAGVMLSAVLFMKTMSDNAQISTKDSDAMGDIRDRLPKGVETFALSGPLFFGAAGSFVEALEATDARPFAFILDMREVPFIDSSGIVALIDVVEKLEKQKIILFISGIKPSVRKQMARVRAVESMFSKIRFVSDFDAAFNIIEKLRK